MDYTRYACIGTRVSKAKLKELEDEVFDMQKEQIEDIQMRDTLNQAQQFERLSQSPEQILSLAGAADELERYLAKKDQLQQELKELEDGTRTAELNVRRETLEREVEDLERKIKSGNEERIGRAGDKRIAESEQKSYEERLSLLQEGFVPNQELLAQVKEVLMNRTEQAYRRENTELLAKLSAQEESAGDQRTSARIRFNNEYPAYGFTSLEHDNDVYDKVLDQLQQDYEPKFKAEFEKQYLLVYHSLRENVIATIHGEIKAAYRHRKEINRMLSRIRFSDSTYQIDILPADNENGQFYEMLMAEELDSKVLDNDGFDGQLSFGEDTFYQKYEQQIERLTEKFMPPKDEDGQKRSLHEASGDGKIC